MAILWGICARGGREKMNHASPGREVSKHAKYTTRGQSKALLGFDRVELCNRESTNSHDTAIVDPGLHRSTRAIWWLVKPDRVRHTDHSNGRKARDVLQRIAMQTNTPGIKDRGCIQKSKPENIRASDWMRSARSKYQQWGDGWSTGWKFLVLKIINGCTSNQSNRRDRSIFYWA